MGYPTADTFASLIDEVITSLQGFGTDNDALATLTESLNDNATTFMVDDTEEIARGIIEIDEEIMYVSSAENGSVVIMPWGRGFKGTVASAHANGSPVSIAPSWPRAVVAREINNTIRAVYPQIFAVKTTDFLINSITWQYELPADVDRVLAVEWRWSNTVDGWIPIHGWETIQSANTIDFTTGKALLISEPLPSGVRIHVTYAAQPTLLVYATDLFTLTGLASSSRDVIVYGAASRLLPWQDTGRVPVETVSSDVQDTVKPVGMGVSVANEIRKLYATRLQDERRALLNRYPSRTHKVR
jgi:hypothetical protein